jgi:hypothetical protein
MCTSLYICQCSIISFASLLARIPKLLPPPPVYPTLLKQLFGDVKGKGEGTKQKKAGHIFTAVSITYSNIHTNNKSLTCNYNEPNL